MGPQGRGQVALMLQISYVLAVSALAGRDRAWPAVNPGGPAVGMRRLVLPGVTLAVITCTVIAAVVWAWSVTTALLVAGLGGLAAANALLTGLRAADAAGAGRRFLSATMTGQVALTAAAVALTTAGISAPPAWVGVYAAALLVPAATAWVRVPAGLLPDLRPARRAGWTLFPGAIAQIIAMRADRLLLPVLAGYDQLGLYVVVATATELIGWPVQAWVDAQTSTWRARYLAGPLRPWRVLAAVGAYVASAATTVGIVLHLLLVPMFGVPYRPTLPLVLPLAAAAGMVAVVRTGAGLTLASGRPRTATIIDVTAMVVSGAGYLLLIPGHGAMGAAVASLLGYGTAALLAVTLVTLIRSR